MKTPTAERRWLEIGSSEAIPEGEARTFAVEGTRIALARAGGKLYAVQDLCTHDDGPLGEGCLDGHAIQCPRHGARFDIRTGAVLSMPAIVPIGTFEVTEQGEVIRVAIDAAHTADDEDDW